MDSTSIENAGVYGLITELCNRTALKCTSNKSVSHKHIVSRMRSCCYEIILKKSSLNAPILTKTTNTPVVDLLSYYYVLQANIKNAAEYKRCIKLKKAINSLQNMEEVIGSSDNSINIILRLLLFLKNSVKEDYSREIFESPFSFGLLESMLPRPLPEVFGSPEPYAYYPDYIFQLPYSMKPVADEQCYTEYSVECFESKSFIQCHTEPKTMAVGPIISPMSMASLLSSQSTQYAPCIAFPRLTTPRELVIPGSTDVNVKVSNIDVK